MKWTILLLFILIAVSSVVPRRKRKYKKVKNALKYVGCKPEDSICDKRPKRFCRFSKNFRYQCPRKCGVCAPYEPQCPKEHVYGCCWDGRPATDFKKSNCPACFDVNENICNRTHVLRDCNFARNTRKTRLLCPVKCGACGDFGNARAPHPARYRTCEDKDERCYKMKDTSCCKDNEILQDLCQKTCGICQSFY
ncbi:uncharacterized protein LOC114523748 [Dendronephthya gigantea]|uniref:uncharacterized protein LOC114523748 n=1 Tax=Dendronephthya gigantea TaxID=151771 RepID=UPI00106CE9A5|nr:uncharacterized protein LOC114523748 [Dendronephthya gigantea]